MCGIAGFCLNPNDHHINARRLAQALLIGIEERGRDATGAAWRNRQGNLVTQKRDVTASKFVPGLSLDKQASLAVLHTRMWTQGKPENPLNNHPILAGDIIGVHNGTVSNDVHLLRIAEKFGYKRQGEVDSEAIFATLDRVSDTFTLDKALELIEARMALAWLDLNDRHDNTLHLARGDGSPLVVAQTGNGSLIFASTHEAITEAAKVCDIVLPYMEDVKEGSYFKVQDGIINETMKFEPTGNWYYSGRSYVSTGTSSSSVKAVTNELTKAHTNKFLDLTYLDPDTDVPEVTPAAFQVSHNARNEAVQKWIEDHAFIEGDDDLDEAHAVFQKAAENGAFLRPGVWVQTHFKGEWCDAQVYRVPKTFPDGDYILRVLAPYWTTDDETFFEAVFLARSVMDLDGDALRFDTSKDDNDTNDSTDGDAIAELSA